MRSALAGLGFALLAGSAWAADAPQPCPLQEAISLDMTTEVDGSVSVPVLLNGKPFMMGLDTGSPYTSIKYETAAQLGLPLAFTLGGSFMNNIQTNQMANLDSLSLGNLEVPWPVLVIPNFIKPWQAGLLGQDVMRSFDVEIDFYRSKLNFFLHNTCTTDAAYWTHAVAVVPFEVNNDQHLVVEAVLDGKEVNAMLDTGAESSIMSLDNAQDTFAIHDNDPRLKTVRQDNINGGEATTVSTFPFSTLTFQGVTITNPQIDLIPKKNFGNERHVDVVLGLNVLRRLHMYIDYSQNKIYLTDAEASK